MNRIKKLLWISLIAAALCYPALSKDLAVNSVWTTATLNIDGDSEDWGDDVFNTEDKLSIDLAFRNDNDFLYILFMFKDPQFMSSIGETGLTVYFNADGKRRKHDGLRFVRQLVSADQFIDILERQRGALTEEQKQEVRLRKSYSIRRYKIIEKKDELDIPTDVEQVQRAIFRTETDKAAKTAVYEIAIPLDKAADKATGIGTEPGQAIKIGFEWGGLTPERREMLMKKIAGDQGVAARSRDASRSNIKSERNRVGDLSPSMSRIAKMAPKQYSFWVDLQLAKQ